MIKGTSSYSLAMRWINQKESAIFTVGYMDPQTPGYKIANSVQGDEIKFNVNDEAKEVQCKIKNFKFSAHSRREDLLNIVESLKPKNVILIHGDEGAIDWIGSSILKNNKQIKVQVAKVGKEIEIF